MDVMKLFQDAADAYQLAQTTLNARQIAAVAAAKAKADAEAIYTAACGQADAAFADADAAYTDAAERQRAVQSELAKIVGNMLPAADASFRTG